MTAITLKKGLGVYSVKCEGHATGSREVCAAISAISMTLRGYLEELGCKILKDEIGDGYFEVVFKGRGAKAAYNMAACGYRLLARDYPQYCTAKIILV